MEQAELAAVVVKFLGTVPKELLVGVGSLVVPLFETEELDSDLQKGEVAQYLPYAMVRLEPQVSKEAWASSPSFGSIPLA